MTPQPAGRGTGSYRFDFEKPLAELEHKLQEARKAAERDKRTDAVKTLEAQFEQLQRKIYGGLTPWQRVQLARHPLRPYTLDYIRMLTSEFVPLHGDRLFSDDRAMVGGFVKLENRPCLVLGHQKGRDTKENLMRNFGSAHPEGYRKALRLMQLAQKLRLPVVVFIDTPGAYPGVGAEERGQAHSIAFNMRARRRSTSASSGKAAPAGRWASGSATGSRCWRTRTTRSSHPKAARPSSGGTGPGRRTRPRR
jgi:acetyl-CoA carboxylase carboxyl transferase subunit alpha